MLKTTDEWTHAGQDVISFGPFQLFPAERRLTRDGQPVKLGSRALDILNVLIENAGRIVGQKELMARVWPGLFVEEVSLRVHIAALRKVLEAQETGQRYLINAPGRGYCFTLQTSRTKAPQGPASLSPQYNLPPRLERMIGREQEVKEICDRISAERLITVVGSGGIGKTTVALAAGHALLESLGGAVCFVDLGRIADPARVAGTVASTFGLPVNSPSPVRELVAHLRTKRVLLILDNCEHLIFAAATLVEQLLSETSDLRILATSREALMVANESVHRLESLGSPPGNARLTAAEIANFPSVRLFMERLRSNGTQLDLDDRNASVVAGICRKLDGIALAIELAAGRVGTFSLRETLAQLDSEFALRWPGRRTAPPRHQTMNATLEWSYNILSENEKKVLRRLSVFVGGFGAEDAQAVAGSLDASKEETYQATSGLITKSLASVGSAGGRARYRLLETTRAYAAAKLREAGEEDLTRRIHAEHFRDLLLETEALRSDPTLDQSGVADIDNIRSALGWAFGPQGDRLLAIDLAAYSASVWVARALFAECSDWMARAMRTLPGTLREGSDQQLMVQMAATACEVFTIGYSERFPEQWGNALQLATKLGDVRWQLFSARALWGYDDGTPNYEDALRMALHCADIARQSPDPGALAEANWMIGVSEQHMGRLDQAKIHLELALNTDRETSRLRMLKETGYDRRVDAMMAMANVLWLQGFPTRASSWVEQAVDEGRRLGRSLPLSAAMTTLAVHGYLSNPDIDAAERDIVELLEQARTHSAISYEGFGLCLLGLCQARRGEFSAARPLVDKGLELLTLAHYGVFHAFIRARLCEGAIAAGERELAREIMTTIDRKDRNAEYWSKPETLRVKGLLARDAGDSRAAETAFSQAMDLARLQGALSWELKTATSLGELLVRDARSEEAARLVGGVYQRFTEGFETSDLVAARDFLQRVDKA